MKYEPFKTYELKQPWLPFSELLMEWEENFHELMLNDHLRMVAYETAIKAVVKPGDVVLDLGTGTGILCQWAFEAGAQTVYGIEMDMDILKLAVQRINTSGFGEQFIPINRLSCDVITTRKSGCCHIRDYWEFSGQRRLSADHKGYTAAVFKTWRMHHSTKCIIIHRACSEYKSAPLR